MPNHRPITTRLALAIALCAIAPAAASARLDLNPPAATTTSSPQPAVQIVRVSAPSGFDWGDAGIGAAGALGLSMLAMGGGLVIADRRRRTPGTSDPGHGATPHGGAAGDLSRGPDSESKLVLNQQEVVTRPAPVSTTVPSDSSQERERSCARLAAPPTRRQPGPSISTPPARWSNSRCRPSGGALCGVC